MRVTLTVIVCCCWAGLSGAQDARRRDRTEALQIFTNLDAGRVERLLRPFHGGAVPVRVTSGDARELTRHLALSGNSVDIALIEGVGYLDEAYRSGLLQRFETATMREAIPYALRSPAGAWFAMSYVVQGHATHDARVRDGPTSLFTQGRSGCLPSATEPRGRALLAALQREHGSKALELLAGWRMRPATADSEDDLLKAVTRGECARAVVHSDAVARFRQSTSGRGPTVVWPQGAHGAPVLTTGIAMTSRLAHYDLVRELLDWTASPEVQSAWASAVLAFPASPFARTPEAVRAIGPIRADLLAPQPTVAALAAAERLAAAAVGAR